MQRIPGCISAAGSECDNIAIVTKDGPTHRVVRYVAPPQIEQPSHLVQLTDDRARTPNLAQLVLQLLQLFSRRLSRILIRQAEHLIRGPRRTIGPHAVDEVGGDRHHGGCRGRSGLANDGGGGFEGGVGGDGEDRGVYADAGCLG